MEEKTIVNVINALRNDYEKFMNENSGDGNKEKRQEWVRNFKKDFQLDKMKVDINFYTPYQSRPTSFKNMNIIYTDRSKELYRTINSRPNGLYIIINRLNSEKVEIGIKIGYELIENWYGSEKKGEIIELVEKEIHRSSVLYCMKQGKEFKYINPDSITYFVKVGANNEENVIDEYVNELEEVIKSCPRVMRDYLSIYGELENKYDKEFENYYIKNNDRKNYQGRLLCKYIWTLVDNEKNIEFSSKNKINTEADYIDEELEENDVLNTTEKINKNLILYGPPGTGKTYNSKILAKLICDGNVNIDIEEVLNKNYSKEEYEEIITSFDEYKKENRIKYITFHQSYGYEDFIQGIKAETKNGQIEYVVKDGKFKEFCDEANKEENQDKNYVFIIDEINRGNISKIFGELITIIEEDKRGTEVNLPYKNNNEEVKFSVPENVYIIGTMNTADRSIAIIDTALRRRFYFEEVLPNSDLFENVEVEGLKIKDLLEKMNKRIEILYDREHTIGHSYFMPLKEENTINKLKEIYKREIIPLLQEYFYDDYGKLQLILGNKIITSEELNTEKYFGKIVDEIESEILYKISYEALNDIENYKI